MREYIQSLTMYYNNKFHKMCHNVYKYMFISVYLLMVTIIVIVKIKWYKPNSSIYKKNLIYFILKVYIG